MVVKVIEGELHKIIDCSWELQSQFEIASSLRPRASLAAVTCSRPGSGDELRCGLPEEGERVDLGKEGGVDNDKEGDEEMDGSDSGSDELHLGGQVGTKYVCGCCSTWPRVVKKCTSDEISQLSIGWYWMKLSMVGVLLMVTGTDQMVAHLAASCYVGRISSCQENLLPRTIPDQTTLCPLIQ